MKSLSIAIILSALLLTADAQQLIKIFTTYATCRLSMPVPNPSSLSLQTQQQFQFESAASKLFHNKITHRDRGENDPYASSRAVLTTVQVNDQFTVNDLLTMEAVISVTFSQVGIYKALKRSPLTGGVEEKVPINLASLLSKVVSEQELVTALIVSGIFPDDAYSNDGNDAKKLELSFEGFDGDFNERGMYSLGDTEIVSNGQNGGWAMFWAGIFFTLVFGSSIAVGSWLYKAEHGHWPFFPNVGESRDIVVREEDLVMEEMIVPSSGGLLGLKGHHPTAASKENSHPNSAARRRRRNGADSPASYDTSAFSPSSQATSATSASRNPLGIKSMRKLNTSFFTPQKSRSKQIVLYDVERLTKSDEKSVKSNVVLFD